MQHPSIHDVIARDHVDVLRREARRPHECAVRNAHARQARLAAKARRKSARSSRRSR